MNANELADKLSSKIFCGDYGEHTDWNVSDAVDMLRKLADENQKLKQFVKPILAHGDDCVGDWDGGELQDLAVKSGLYIEKTMTEPCNLGNEEFQACPCREYCYGDDSWECYRIAEFLLEEEE